MLSIENKRDGLENDGERGGEKRKRRREIQRRAENDTVILSSASSSTLFTSTHLPLVGSLCQSFQGRAARTRINSNSRRPRFARLRQKLRDVAASFAFCHSRYCPAGFNGPVDELANRCLWQTAAATCPLRGVLISETTFGMPLHLVLQLLKPT
ncbi:hypothetical protein ANTQUA_LOCUS4101 [Anthophora quadrimaculata]